MGKMTSVIIMNFGIGKFCLLQSLHPVNTPKLLFLSSKKCPFTSSAANSRQDGHCQRLGGGQSGPLISLKGSAEINRTKEVQIVEKRET